uniref:peptide-methionine (S)-S-oxide reductase n=1 Tax=Trieres chinensis TaxID=1514140 RepID=A0A7S2A4F0_TRICV
MALHDPTKVRAHGKHAGGTGQYRSCVFASDRGTAEAARSALEDCQEQLGKELSTEVRLMDSPVDSWFFRAEDRHQRRDERVKKGGAGFDASTLSMTEWLQEYGRRSASVWGSGGTVQVQDDYEDNDDGMARMMI